jgi:hypothetical protein
MGRRKKEAESADSDLTYFAKERTKLIQMGSDKTTAWAEAFGRTIGRARAEGAFVFARMVVARILMEEEIEANRGAYFAAATELTSKVLKGDWKRVEGAKNRIANSNLDSGAIEKILDIFGF